MGTAVSASGTTSILLNWSPKSAKLSMNWARSGSVWTARACGGESGGVNGSGGKKVGFLERKVGDLRGMISALPPIVVKARKNIGSNLTLFGCFAVAFLAFVASKIIRGNQSRINRGSVAELVRRGHISERRGIGKSRLYDDPFNNPLVKIDEGKSTVQMFGKAYRLAPVTLTKEEQSMHQKRRSRAYQWKRPTVFLREGEPIPPDVDPDTVRWIPANHPFAATSTEIDEEIAKKNVYQKDGVPFRVKLEHEALKRKMDLLKDDQKPSEQSASSKSMRDVDSQSRSSDEYLGKIHEHPKPGTRSNKKNGNVVVKSDEETSDDRS